MNRTSYLTAAFVSAGLLLASYSTPSYATAQSNDNLGLLTNPTCDLGRDFKSALKAFRKEIPHGEKTLTEKWELEIYKNAEAQTWTLMGKSLDKSHPSYFLCRLAQGQGDYTEQKWYQEFFAKKSVPAPATDIPPVAIDSNAPKPQIP